MSAEIPVVISSVPNVSGLQYAEEDGTMDIEIVERSRYGNLREFSEANFDICRRYGVHYVVLAGYLKFLEIPKDFENRVLNIHPSLIPSFCGRGFYGNIVHAKVIEHGVKVSGCTVHFVDQDYDSGPIILQRAVDVKDDDTPDSLNQRVFDAERIAYPEAIDGLYHEIAHGWTQVKAVGRSAVGSDENSFVTASCPVSALCPASCRYRLDRPSFSISAMKPPDFSE